MKQLLILFICVLLFSTPMYLTGWLFYDSMHTGNAANTNPNGKVLHH